MKKIITLILTIILIVSCFLLLNYKEEEIIFVDEVQPLTKETSASMVMVGDMLLHGAVYQDAKTGNTYDFKPMVELIKPIVSTYDLAFYNQESILGGTELGLSSYPRFNSPYEAGDAMIDAGFNMVSLANNHTLDKSTIGINNSLNYWKTKTDILTAGSYDSFESRNEVQVKTINDITYTMLAYTYGTNGLPVPKGKEYLVNVYDPVQVKEDIERVRDKVDVLIVSMHWGNEYVHTPPQKVQEQAEYLAGLGVDIIVGHHPHVVEPITRIGDTVVIYSLGNFVSAQIGTNKLVGLMASLRINKKTVGTESTITIDNIGSELLYTYYDSHIQNFKVIPFSEISSYYLSNYDDVYETYSNIVKQYDDTITVNALKK